MHYLRNNKTGKFVSGLLHSIQYGVPCRFITDGNVVLKNMASTYGIDMDDFSVLPATPIPGVTQMKNRILSNVLLNRRAMLHLFHNATTKGVPTMLTASYHPFPGAIKLFIFWEVSNPAGSGCSTVYATSVHSAREFFAHYCVGYSVTHISRRY